MSPHENAGRYHNFKTEGDKYLENIGKLNKSVWERQ